METIQDAYDESLSDRAIKHLQGLGLPMFETQGLMRHILDCLGTLKVRLEEDSVIAPHLLTIFADTLKIFADHLSGFDPIDNESGVKYLIQAFPDDNKRRDGRAWLPVHLAAANHNVEPEVLAAVVKERPLHLLKGHLHDPNDLYGQGEASLDRDNLQQVMGLTPLHLLASLQHPNMQNCQLLVEKAPEAVRVSDHRGFMPLHYCAYNTRSLEVCSLLVKLYPDACFEPTKKGKLPFQLAAYNKYTMIMDIILEANPNAIDTMDYNGNTPLHDACKSLNYEGCRKLLSMKKELNRTRNFNNVLPIHNCFFSIHKDNKRLQYKQLETIKVLMVVNPEIATYPDEDGRLPLHLACLTRAHFEIVEFLYSIYPSGALVRDREGNMPVQYVSNMEDVKKMLLGVSKPLQKTGMTSSFVRFT
eukprot:gene27481-33186_t